MAYNYLTKDNIFDRYTAAAKYTDDLTAPFQEFERIARNRPSDKIDPNYPKTTDGTTASIIRKTPRRVVQQLPTGLVDNDEDDWLSIVADFILRQKILLYANEEYDLIQKCWSTIEGALTFGACATYTPFLNHDGYFCPDVTTIYWGDIKLQPGKKSIHACKYKFVRSWWQPEDIEALIDREQKLEKSVKERQKQQKKSGEPVEADYESSWDIAELKRVKDAKSPKDDPSKTPMERDRGVNQTGVEFITGFQEGVGGEFFTFHQGEKAIVRTEKNKDPRGKDPVNAMYGDIDGSNPFGRGIVELVGGLQNLIDADMQMYQYNRALMLAPPLFVKGQVNNPRLVPNAVMKTTDPNASIDTIKIDTSAVTNYPQLYQLQQSQLFNLVQSPQSTNSGTDAAMGQGKTPTALNQQAATVSIDDNYVRKMFEAWFEDWAETAINIYFAKRRGIEELQLDEDTIEALENLAKEGKFDMGNINEKGQIRIDYDTATPALKFRVDASTSKMKDDQDQLNGLGLLKEALDGSQVLSGIVPPEKVLGLWNKLVDFSKVEDPEELKVDVDEWMQQQEEAAQQAQAAQEQQMGMQQDQQMIDAAKLDQQAQQPGQFPPPEMTLEQGDAPVAPEDEAIIDELQALGLPDEVIAEAISLLEDGADPNQLLEMLGITQPEGVA